MAHIINGTQRTEQSEVYGTKKEEKREKTVAGENGELWRVQTLHFSTPRDTNLSMT